MRISVLLGAKNSEFLVCPHGRVGGGVNFHEFVRTSFMDGP